MTEQHRTVAAERDLPRVHEWLNQVVAHAMREAHAADRAIGDIRQWLAHEQHLMDTCETADCLECEARSSVLYRLAALLPAVGDTPIRRGSSAEGGDSSGHASDALRRRGRPGHVNPGGSETGGGYRTP